MKVLRNFICRHPVWALVLLLIPCALITFALVYMRWVDPIAAPVLLGWAVFFLSFPIRRMPAALMRDAARALDRDLDPDTFLSMMDVLRARRSKNLLYRLSVGANYAAGLDAKGQSREALAYLRTLLPQRPHLDGANGVQFDLSYAVVAVHSEEGREEVGAVLATVRAALPTLPPPLAAAVRETAESVHMAYAAYTGTESTSTLIDYYVRAVGRYRAEGEMGRRRLIRTCMNLATVYDRADRFADAAAMYAYVAENGGALGVVSEAKEARAALSLRESAARMEEAASKNSL